MTKSNYLPRLLTTLLLVVATNLKPTNALLCPDAATIAPCFCTIAFEYFECLGPQVTQSTLENFFLALRTVNGLQDGEWLSMTRFQFRLESTNIETLDLSPFFYNHLYWIQINGNLRLHSINSSLEITQPVIRTSSLTFQNNKLTDEGLVGALTLFDPYLLTSLSLVYNELAGGSWDIGDGSGDIEFISGLSSLTHLTHLYLTGNPIKKIGGGQFKRMVKLEMIDLSITDLEQLEENAWLQVPIDGVTSPGSRVIYLYGNPLLSDEGIHPNHGLDSWQGSTEVYFDDCHFEYLTSARWENFLKVNDMTNQLHFRSNEFFCDRTMEWLRDGRDIYEQRVFQVICDNDPEHRSIFSTEIDLGEPTLLCPLAESIAPCTCSRISSKLACEGAAVGQNDVDNLFKSFRAVNTIDDGDWVDIFSFSLTKTDLPNLDLSPLFYSRFERIEIENNYRLVTINGTASSDGQKGLIDTVELSLNSNNLSDPGVGDSLTLFSGRLKRFTADFNNFEGGQVVIEDGSGDIEFLKGFGSFVNLDFVTFTYNKISVLGGGQFKRNNKIWFLSLTNNQIGEWQENAWLIDDLDDDSNGVDSSTIYFHHNPLTDDKIHANHGLDKWTRRVTVDFDSNNFQSLSETNFQNFLTANNHSNVLYFSSNHFFCDSRLKWLKDGRVDYESRVHYVYCSNDLGETAFTSDLV